MKPRPRGGTKTSLVDVRERIAPFDDVWPVDCADVTDAQSAAPASTLPAPAEPARFSISRLETGFTAPA
jgi:hypothetical protein